MERVKDLLGDEEYERLLKKKVTFFGYPIDDMSEEELRVILALSIEDNEREAKQHKKSIDFLNELNEGMRRRMR